MFQLTNKIPTVFTENPMFLIGNETYAALVNFMVVIGDKRGEKLVKTSNLHSQFLNLVNSFWNGSIDVVSVADTGAAVRQGGVKTETSIIG